VSQKLILESVENDDKLDELLTTLFPVIETTQCEINGPFDDESDDMSDSNVEFYDAHE
jgi:hypothetical protein